MSKTPVPTRGRRGRKRLLDDATGPLDTPTGHDARKSRRLEKMAAYSSSHGSETERQPSTHAARPSIFEHLPVELISMIFVQCENPHLPAVTLRFARMLSARRLQLEFCYRTLVIEYDPFLHRPCFGRSLETSLAKLYDRGVGPRHDSARIKMLTRLIACRFFTWKFIGNFIKHAQKRFLAHLTLLRPGWRAMAPEKIVPNSQWCLEPDDFMAQTVADLNDLDQIPESDIILPIWLCRMQGVTFPYKAFAAPWNDEARYFLAWLEDAGAGYEKGVIDPAIPSLRRDRLPLPFPNTMLSRAVRDNAPIAVYRLISRGATATNEDLRAAITTKDFSMHVVQNLLWSHCTDTKSNIDTLDSKIWSRIAYLEHEPPCTVDDTDLARHSLKRSTWLKHQLRLASIVRAATKMNTQGCPVRHAIYKPDDCIVRELVGELVRDKLLDGWLSHTSGPSLRSPVLSEVFRKESPAITLSSMVGSMEWPKMKHLFHTTHMTTDRQPAS